MWQEMGNRELLPKYANFLRSVESIRKRTKENLHRTVIKKGEEKGGLMVCAMVSFVDFSSSKLLVVSLMQAKRRIEM